MKCPESTATVRSAGSSASSAIESARGSRWVASPASSNGASRQEPSAISRSSPGVARKPAVGHAGGEQRLGRRGGVADDARRATGRCAPSDSSSRSTCTTFAPRAISLPSRVVQRVRSAPKASTRSASAISRAAIGEANPPEMPTAQAEPSNRPWPIAEVASTAPIASPRRSSGSRAPASTAPRPATITGRRAAAISVGDLRHDVGRGRRALGLAQQPGRGAAGRRLGLDVERHVEHDRAAARRARGAAPARCRRRRSRPSGCARAPRRAWPRGRAGRSRSSSGSPRAAPRPRARAAACGSWPPRSGRSARS